MLFERCRPACLGHLPLDLIGATPFVRVDTLRHEVARRITGRPDSRETESGPCAARRVTRFGLPPVAIPEGDGHPVPRIADLTPQAAIISNGASYIARFQ
jgi:hypothetical protein